MPVTVTQCLQLQCYAWLHNSLLAGIDPLVSPPALLPLAAIFSRAIQRLHLARPFANLRLGHL